MASLTLVIQSSRVEGVRKSASQSRETARDVINLLQAAASGHGPAIVDAHESSVNGVAASGSIAITHAELANNDTVTVGGVVITAKTSGATGAEFNIGADAAADAVNLAAAINANATLSPHVVASAATGTVTITARVKGSIANLIRFATSKSSAFTLTQPSGGAGGPSGAAVTYVFP
jgi:phage tail sheath gpL-like